MSSKQKLFNVSTHRVSSLKMKNRKCHSRERVEIWMSLDSMATIKNYESNDIPFLIIMLKTKNYVIFNIYCMLFNEQLTIRGTYCNAQTQR